MNKAIKWWWFLAAIPLLIFFRIAGLVDNFWVAIGIVSLGAGLALLQMIPDTKLNPLSKVFIIWAIISIGLPLTMSALTKKLPPRTKEAVEQRGVWNDIQTAEKIRPNGLEELTVFRRWSNHEDKISAAYFNKKYKELQDNYEASRITYEQVVTTDKALRQEIEDRIRWRQQASDFIKKGQSRQDQEPALYDKAQNVVTSLKKSLGGKLVLLGLIGIAALFISAIPKMPGKKIFVGAGSTFLVIALVVGTILFLWPDIKAGAEELKKDYSDKSAKSTPGAQTAQPKRIYETKPSLFEVRPDRLSEKLSIDSRCFDFKIDGPETVKIIDSRGEVICHIGDPSTQRLINEIGLRGVRFIGPESVVTVYLTPRG
ncbi:MAG: hypothetical protein V1845_03920 [bacterium]